MKKIIVVLIICMFINGCSVQNNNLNNNGSEEYPLNTSGNELAEVNTTKSETSEGTDESTLELEVDNDEHKHESSTSSIEGNEIDDVNLGLFEIVDLGTNPGNLPSSGGTVEYGGDVFFNTVSDGLARMNTDGTVVEGFYDRNMYFMQAFDGWIYGAVYSTDPDDVYGELIGYERINIETKDVEIIHDDIVRYSYIYGKSLFISNEVWLYEYDIENISLEPEEYLLEDIGTTYFVINSGNIYYYNRCINLENFNEDTFETGYGNCFFSNGKFYYSDREHIYVKDSVDGEATIVADCLAEDFIIESSKIYISDREEGLYSVGLDGQEKRILNESRVDRLTLSGGWLFFTEENGIDFAMYRMRLDGSDKTQIN